MSLTQPTEVITWESYEAGRHGELMRLNRERNDVTLPKHRRSAAAKAHAKITAQLKDKKLMALRERLIRAAQAGDPVAIAKITAMMKDYAHEDRETGHYGI
jgi:hypothetical protein